MLQLAGHPREFSKVRSEAHGAISPANSARSKVRLIGLPPEEFAQAGAKLGIVGVSSEMGVQGRRGCWRKEHPLTAQIEWIISQD